MRFDLVCLLDHYFDPRISKGGVLQGFLSLCIPFYIIYYAFARFEHPKKKNLIVLGYLVGAILAGVFLSMAGVYMPHPV